ncbi:hypothetical protein NBRC111893_446 [Lentilactobacillus kosonis]|uniref:Uncharacterized protein n=1 Tax=Lentilactobacillus kosonis TaxID=2810561 RepID=A0A401FIU0_9LACO|nr:hypothetical protein NBRC111893_446 [Lentilactobacillus kosonis]
MNYRTLGKPVLKSAKYLLELGSLVVNGVPNLMNSMPLKLWLKLTPMG